MLKFLHKERGIKGVSRKLISDLRPQTPKTQTFIANSSQFLSPNVLWSHNVQRQQPERIEIFIFSGLSLSHRSNSENLTRLMTFAGEFFFRRNRKAESL